MSTTRLASRPPSTEMSARSSTEMLFSMPKLTAATLASSARTNDSTIVRESDSDTF